ncbi:MHJ_0274 family protein [Metamycoplasma spumans]|uniref:MHJ_0274 family protein n=1 Tax=Metamycoplasma spumans TaxID=92406 RepID=UPI0034DD3068
MKELINYETNDTIVQSPSSSQGSGITNIIVYVLLGVVLAFVIGYMIWKIIKNKVKKQKLAKLEAIKANEVLDSYYEYILSFQEVILYTQNELKDFEVSIGKISMGQIKTGAKKLLFKLISRDDFASSFVNNEQYKTFVEHAELINITPCNLWEKKIPETLEYFKQQYDLVPAGEKRENYLELVKKSIQEKFYA